MRKIWIVATYIIPAIAESNVVIPRRDGEIAEILGEKTDETGFDLEERRRDLFYEIEEFRVLDVQSKLIAKGYGFGRIDCADQ